LCILFEIEKKIQTHNQIWIQERKIEKKNKEEEATDLFRWAEFHDPAQDLLFLSRTYGPRTSLTPLQSAIVFFVRMTRGTHLTGAIFFFPMDFGCAPQQPWPRSAPATRNQLDDRARGSGRWRVGPGTIVPLLSLLNRRLRSVSPSGVNNFPHIRWSSFVRWQSSTNQEQIPRKNHA
jgi:hypothetical protein